MTNRIYLAYLFLNILLFSHRNKHIVTLLKHDLQFFKKNKDLYPVIEICIVLWILWLFHKIHNNICFDPFRYRGDLDRGSRSFTFPFFFTHLQCNSTFRLWVVTATSSTAPLCFFIGKEEVSAFSGVRGWPFFFCSAGESCLNGEQERNTTSRNPSVATDRPNQSAGTNGTPPWQKSGLKSVGYSLSFADISSSVDWQTGNWQLSPLASTPLRV